MTALTALLLLALAPAGPNAAHDAVTRARAHFEAGRFAEASAAFAEAYVLDPQRAYVYAQAQAQRLGGDCRAAIPLYKRFLELDPGVAEAGDARDNLVRCAEVLASEPQGPASTPAQEGPAPAPAVDTRPVSAPSPRRWPRDPPGGVLVATGAAGLLAGIGLSVAAAVEQRAARGAFLEDDYAAHTRAARLESRAGIGCFVAGGVLALAGVIRYVVVARRSAARPRQAFLGYGVRF